MEWLPFEKDNRKQSTPNHPIHCANEFPISGKTSTPNHSLKRKNYDKYKFSMANITSSIQIIFEQFTQELEGFENTADAWNNTNIKIS